LKPYIIRKAVLPDRQSKIRSNLLSASKAGRGMEAMFQISIEESYRDGQMIFEEGSHGDWIYIVESGEIELIKSYYGRDTVIETLGVGEIFGEIAFLANTPRTAGARAKGETTIGIFDRKFLDNEFNKLSASFQAIIKRLALRFKSAAEAAVQSQVRRNSPRIAKVLSLSFKSGTGLVRAFSENVNADGLFVKTSQVLPEGERFFLNLQLPDDPGKIQIGCEVAWITSKKNHGVNIPEGMGIKFVQISKKDRRKIVKALEQAGA